MGTVYHETYTKPLPDDAELFTRKDDRFARWQQAACRFKERCIRTGRRADRDAPGYL